MVASSAQSTVQQALERRILNGLIAEWERAVNDLRWARRGPTISLPPQPGFMLEEMKPLGRWNSAERMISLNREFVLAHPWDAVVDVLKHEIAHQLVTQALGAPPEPPHGPVFQYACRLLRADPRPSSEYQSLHEYIREGKATEADRILEKVNKLLALAQSSSEHEAREAMRKAHSLMHSYNLGCLEQRTARRYFSIFLGKPSLRHTPVESWMGCLLREYYFVETIWVQAYVLEKDRMGNVLEISGTSENLAMAEYVFSFVNRYIDQAWDEYRRLKKVSGKRRQTDFAVGVIKGFRESLAQDEREKVAPANSSALVRARDTDLQGYFRFRFPRISTRGGSSRQIDQETTDAGMELGRKLKIHRGIHEASSGPVRLLPEK